MAKVIPSEVKTLTEKLRLVSFKENEQGQPADMRFWADEAFAELIVVGTECDIKGEKRPQKNDPSKEDYWVKSVNGTEGKAPKSGGGGGYKQAPKTAQEIHSASICGILKSCIESKLDTTQATNWVEVYLLSMAKVKS